MRVHKKKLIKLKYSDAITLSDGIAVFSVLFILLFSGQSTG